MLRRIKGLLEALDINEYKIIETKTDSNELFYVKKDLDMERTKTVQHFKVTVYKNIEQDGIKYTGSSEFNIHPTMEDEEIRKAINDATFSAGFVKNEYYELPEANKENVCSTKSQFSSMELEKWMPKLTEALYANDTEEKGGINSAEIFLERIYTRVVTSKGTDVSYEKYNGMIEFITTWREEHEEEIELYKMLTFSDYDPEYIKNSVKERIELAKERTRAKQMPPSGKYKIILTGSDVVEVFSYYVNAANAATVYDKISNYKIGDSVQGDKVSGDLLNLTLDPTLSNSAYSVPIDDDGLALHKTAVIENGKLMTYHGSFRYNYYLQNKPTGTIKNVVVAAGSKSVKEMRKGPYIELAAFSDFQMDSITGDFGGEIRLGWYCDGNTRVPITGGSLSGNIKKVHSNMHFSKELQKVDHFYGPKSIEMYDLTIAGK